MSDEPTQRQKDYKNLMDEIERQLPAKIISKCCGDLVVAQFREKQSYCFNCKKPCDVVSAPQEPQSETPRTDAFLLRRSLEKPWNKYTNDVPAGFARTLERELNEANKKLDLISTDKDYVGGTQYWISKHDELAVMVAELAKQNHKMREALAHSLDCYSNHTGDYFSESTSPINGQISTRTFNEYRRLLQEPDTSSLIVLSRAEVEDLPCICGTFSHKTAQWIGKGKCERCTLLERFTK